jgi:hypothetical protein
LAGAIITFHLFWLPDLFVFLIWEIKENWSLYRANRGKSLQPVIVGAHGETVRGLLQPGFHSGTVPNLYAKLRIAERVATKTRNWHSARAYRHEVEEVADTLRNFVAREMVALLNQSLCWRGNHVAVGPVHLATNRFRLELIHGEHPVHPVEIEIEHRNGWLVAGVRANGWLDKISDDQLQAFCVCLAGLYKRADIDLVREQIQGELGGIKSFQLTYEGLQVWSDPHVKPVQYPLRDCEDHPERIVELERLVYARIPIAWAQWVDCWEKDQAGKPGLPGLAEALVRVPGRTTTPKADGPVVLSVDQRFTTPAKNEERTHGQETTQPRPETQSEAGRSGEEAPAAVSLTGLQGQPIQDG